MRALYLSCAFGLAVLASNPALAQDDKAARDVEPGAAREGVVRVNAVKNPEMHAYRAIVAGLDMFDDAHALAPNVPRLLFVAEGRGGKPLVGAPPTAKLSADDFNLALPLDADGLFTVPRSERAWDAKAELVLSRKRREVRVMPYIRSPGLAPNQRRLGDLRLECKVLIAVVKQEAPFWAVGLANTVLLTSDWCSFFKDDGRSWSVEMPAELAKATLHEGNRSKALQVDARNFELPLADPSWGNDAIVDLQFAPAVATAGSPTP